MAHVEVEPGVRLFVQEWGEGPPVVFIHGGGMTHDFWQHQVAALCRRFRTITFDLRGCGDSDCPNVTYSIELWARDLRALVERLELDRPVVVGHAVGSHVALRFAIEHPDMLDKLVLAAAAPWATGDREQDGGFSEEFWKNLQHAMLTNRAQAELMLADNQYFHGDPGEGIRLWGLQMALQWPLPVYLGLFETFSQVDHREDLPNLRVPTLVMHGRHDIKNRYEGGVYLAEHIPGARLVTFEDSAHCIPLEEVERFNEVLTEFLLAAPAPAGAAASHAG